MKALVRLDTSCSKRTLESGYAKRLARFKKSLSPPVKTVPPKMHITVVHLDRAFRETGPV